MHKAENKPTKIKIGGGVEEAKPKQNQFKQVEINITKIGYSNGKELSNTNQRNGSLKANEIG